MPLATYPDANIPYVSPACDGTLLRAPLEPRVEAPARQASAAGVDEDPRRPGFSPHDPGMTGAGRRSGIRPQRPGETACYAS